MLPKNFVFLILIFPFFTGCGSLNEVNKYTSVSVASLNKIKATNYTFAKYCSQDCELQQLRSGKIDTLFDCDCRQPAAKADEAIQKIHLTVTSYLDAIAQLSNNKIFTYDISNLTASLQQNPLLNLTNNQVAIYTKAGNFISTSATAFYRQKKLKQYLEKADPVFQQLTEAFIFLIDDRLRKQLRINYEINLSNTNQMLDNAKNDKGLKQLIMKVFLDQKANYEKNNALISTYTALLNNAKKGHHELYLHRSELKKIKSVMEKYTKEIQNIVSAVENN